MHYGDHILQEFKMAQWAWETTVFLRTLQITSFIRIKYHDNISVFIISDDEYNE